MEYDSWLTLMSIVSKCAVHPVFWETRLGECVRIAPIPNYGMNPCVSVRMAKMLRVLLASLATWIRLGVSRLRPNLYSTSCKIELGSMVIVRTHGSIQIIIHPQMKR